MMFWRMAFGLFLLMGMINCNLKGQGNSEGVIFLREFSSPLMQLTNGFAVLESGDSIDISGEGDRAMNVVIWMNHAETDTIGLDPGLSYKGHRKADKLARLFRPDDLSGVYITHYRRTYLTVQPLIEALMPPVFRYEPGDQRHFAEQLLLGEEGVSLVVGHERSLPVLTSFLLGGSDPGLSFSEHNFLLIGKVSNGNISELYKFKY